MLSAQSPACRQNAISLIVVGVVFGVLWIGGMILQGVGLSALGQDGIKAAAASPPPSTVDSAYGHFLMFMIGGALAAVGFIALVIGMPILGAARSKMACDI